MEITKEGKLYVIGNLHDKYMLIYQIGCIFAAVELYKSPCNGIENLKARGYNNLEIYNQFLNATPQKHPIYF